MQIAKIGFFILVMAGLSAAQTVEMKRRVLASGGNEMANQNYRIGSTVGQAIIGKASGAGTIIASGFWYADIDMATSVEQNTETIPREFRLKQNYPNPFNPSTTIASSIAKSARVNLTLYDLLGRKVLTLRDERMQPGEYEFTLDASELASGVYFYRLSAMDDDNGNHIFTRKLTLIK